MALDFKKKPVEKNPNAPVDYSQHLTSKPITSMVTIEKKEKYAKWEGPIGMTKVEHPGVFNKKNSGVSITVEGGQTITTNFNSVRLGGSITIPCDPELINEAFEFGSDFLSQKFKEALKES